MEMILSVVVAFAVLMATVASEELFTISTPDQFKTMWNKYIVVGSAVTINLGANIDLSSVGFIKPLGSYSLSGAERLCGAWKVTFNGNNYKISNLVMQGRGTDLQVGLFCDLADGSTVKNVVFDSNCNINGKYAGIVAARASGSVVLENVETSASVSATEAGGGLIGDFRDGSITISKCKNKGAVAATASTDVSLGGLVGYYSSSGSALSNTIVSITDVVNSGSVKGTGAQFHAGGLIGKLSLGAVSKTVTLTVNVGQNTAEVSSTGTINAHSGALFGSMLNVAGTVTSNILSFTNDGTISSSGKARYAGGIIGYLQHVSQSQTTLRFCTNNKAVSSTKDGTGSVAAGAIAFVVSTLNDPVDSRINIISFVNNGMVSGIVASGVVQLATTKVGQALVQNCANYGEISGQNAAVALGVSINTVDNFVNKYDAKAADPKMLFCEACSSMSNVFTLQPLTGATTMTRGSSGDGYYTSGATSERVDQLLNRFASVTDVGKMWNSELVHSLNIHKIEFGAPVNEKYFIEKNKKLDSTPLPKGYVFYKNSPREMFAPDTVITGDLVLVMYHTLTYGQPISKVVYVAHNTKLSTATPSLPVTTPYFVVNKGVVFVPDTVITSSYTFQMCHKIMFGQPINKVDYVEHKAKLNTISLPPGFVFYNSEGKISVATETVIEKEYSLLMFRTVTLGQPISSTVYLEHGSKLGSITIPDVSAYVMLNKITSGEVTKQTTINDNIDLIMCYTAKFGQPIDKTALVEHEFKLGDGINLPDFTGYVLVDQADPKALFDSNTVVRKNIVFVMSHNVHFGTPISQSVYPEHGKKLDGLQLPDYSSYKVINKEDRKDFDFAMDINKDYELTLCHKVTFGEPVNQITFVGDDEALSTALSLPSGIEGYHYLDKSDQTFTSVYGMQTPVKKSVEFVMCHKVDFATPELVTVYIEQQTELGSSLVVPKYLLNYLDDKSLEGVVVDKADRTRSYNSKLIIDKDYELIAKKLVHIVFVTPMEGFSHEEYYKGLKEAAKKGDVVFVRFVSSPPGFMIYAIEEDKVQYMVVDVERAVRGSKCPYGLFCDTKTIYEFGKVFSSPLSPSTSSKISVNVLAFFVLLVLAFFG